MVFVLVSDLAGWHEHRFMCDRQCRKDGFKFYDIASIMVEDDGRLDTINLCMIWYNLREEERKEPAVSGKRWRIIVGEKSSRGKLSPCLGSKMIWECYAAQKMHAQSLLNERRRH